MIIYFIFIALDAPRRIYPTLKWKQKENILINDHISIKYTCVVARLVFTFPTISAVSAHIAIAGAHVYCR